MLIRLLVISSRRRLRERICEVFASTDVLVTVENHSDRLWARLGQESFDLVVADRDSLPTSSISEVRDLPDRPEVILISDKEDSGGRADFQTAGAFAVIPQDLDDHRFSETLLALVSRYREIGIDRLLAEERPRSALDDFSSDSPSMRRLLTLARKVVGADSSLLILGETGVGKEWLGRAIHEEGPRSKAPFVALNCAAIPESLMESELFGHERGAFTGAVKARRGAFELAHQGTLFLDEIADLPVHQQVKLLRAVQDKRIQRVGSERPLQVDVRIMAATNRDLQAAMEIQEFRRDLFYRLSVVTLTVPALRDRPMDIVPLTKNYLAKFKTQFAREHLRGIDETAIDAMKIYDWPGNVRELINVMERAVLLCDGEVVSLDDLPEEIASAAGAPERLAATARIGGFGSWLDQPLAEGREALIETYEREYLERVLEMTNGSIAETARRAGIDPRTLYNKMKALEISKEWFRNRGDMPS